MIVANDVRVQPGEEVLVPCSLKRAVPNTEYLLEPHHQQDEWQEGDQLPTIKVPVEHAIHLKPNATPQWTRPCRLAPDVRKEVRKKIDYLLKQGLVREMSPPWAAPIVTASRKNGHLRLAMDYRRLNGLAQPQHPPLPLIDNLVDQLTDAKFFSAVDLKSGYYQMQMWEEDASKTSFVIPDGQ